MVAPAKGLKEGSNRVFFLETTYEEAYDLLLEARDYLEKRVPELRRAASPPFRLVLTQETTRLTTRMTQVMAWLLTQKALYLEGASSAAVAKHVYRLGGHTLCLERGCMDYDVLPRQFRSLLKRSLDLYQRIDRLDRQLKRAA